MKSFLKQVFASFLGSCFSVGFLFAALVAGTLLLIAGLSTFIVESAKNSAAGEVRKMPERAVLVLDLSRGFSDAPTLSPANSSGIFSSGKGAYGLLDVQQTLKVAAEDDAICAVLLLGGEFSGTNGYASQSEVSIGIAEFRASGKPVFAYLPTPALGDYFLATAGDEIWIHPFSELPLQGLASSGLYFKDALDKIGIGVQITRVGTHKSAVEPLVSGTMSAEDRAQRSRLVNELSRSIFSDIARSRASGNAEKTAEASEARAQKIFEKIVDEQMTRGLVPAKIAGEKGFVDAAIYEDEMIERLKKIAGTDAETHSFNQVAFDDYMKLREIVEEPPLALDNSPLAENFAETQIAESENFSDEPALAVVYAEGEIVNGAGTVDEVGGKTYSGILRELRNDDSVKAVVLRINSPGGSVFASEQIRREAELLAREKTLVVSMGDVAASGGYWISTPAKKVFALPATVTGSIGVFGVLFNFENLGKNLGINSEAVLAAPFAEIETVRRPKTPEEMAIIQKSTEKIYADFLTLVAKARGMSLAEADAVAQGQVWLGLDALRNGLVDEFGTLDSAIAFAREDAGLSDDAPIISFPGNVNRFQELFDAFDDSTAPVARAGTLLSRETNPTLKFLTEKLHALAARLRAFNDPAGIYARLPFDVERAE